MTSHLNFITGIQNQYKCRPFICTDLLKSKKHSSDDTYRNLQNAVNAAHQAGAAGFFIPVDLNSEFRHEDKNQLSAAVLQLTECSIDSSAKRDTESISDSHDDENGRDDADGTDDKNDQNDKNKNSDAEHDKTYSENENLLACYVVFPSGHYEYFDSPEQARAYVSGDARVYTLHIIRESSAFDILNRNAAEFLTGRFREKSEAVLSQLANVRLYGMERGICAQLPDIFPNSVMVSKEIISEFEKTNSAGFAEKAAGLFLDVLGCEQIRFDFYSAYRKIMSQALEKLTGSIRQACGKDVKLIFSLPVKKPDEPGVNPAGKISAYVQKILPEMPVQDAFDSFVLSSRGAFGLSDSSFMQNHVSDENRGYERYAVIDFSASDLRRCSFSDAASKITSKILDGDTVFCPKLDLSDAYDFETPRADVSDDILNRTAGSGSGDGPNAAGPQYGSPAFYGCRKLCDYASMLSLACNEGKRDCCTLVMLPVSSLYINACLPSEPSKDPSEKTYPDQSRKQFCGIYETLIRTAAFLHSAHIPFDTVYEDDFSDSAVIENSIIKIRENSYSEIIIPGFRTLEEGCFSVLCRFARAGGRIISFGNLPYRINGRVDSRMKLLARPDTETEERAPSENGENPGAMPQQSKAKAPDTADIDECLNDTGNASRFILPPKNDRSGCSVRACDSDTDADKIIFTKRTFGRTGTSVYIFFNPDKKHSAELGIKLDENRTLTGLCLDDMSLFKINVIREGRYSRINASVPAQTCFAVLASGDMPHYDIQNRQYSVIPAENLWNIRSGTLNYLPLTHLKYAVGSLVKKENGRGLSVSFPELSEKTLPLKAMDTLMRRRENIPVMLSYSFKISNRTPLEKLGDFYVLHGYSGEWTVNVNGHPVKSAFSEHAVCGCLEYRNALNISEYIKNGTNEIIFSGIFSQKPEVFDYVSQYMSEHPGDVDFSPYEGIIKSGFELTTVIKKIYLCGNFGVYGDSEFIHAYHGKSIEYGYGANSPEFSFGGEFTVCEQPGVIRGCSLAENGYPFFTGDMTLSQNFRLSKKTSKRVYLSLPEIISPAAKITVNNMNAGFLPRFCLNGEDFRINPQNRRLMDISDIADQGSGTVEISLFVPENNLAAQNYEESGSAFESSGHYILNDYGFMI